VISVRVTTRPGREGDVAASLIAPSVPAPGHVHGQIDGEPTFAAPTPPPAEQQIDNTAAIIASQGI
jgi:hypothetical protein